MGTSRSCDSFRLYRKLACAVIFVLFYCATLELAVGQFAKRPQSSQGPRALGVVELAANGKARLVGVTIMLDGRFYDAGSYKADPVPMALHSQIVYEAVKSGVPQGLFTVEGARPTDKGWLGEGKWRTTAELDAEKAKAKTDADRKAQKAPPPEQQIGGPPRLKRAPDTSPASQPQPPAPNPSSAPPKTANASPQPKPAPPPVEDPNRPMLRRQAPSETTREQTKAGGELEPLQGKVQFIPAISDSDGPDPRPYNYPMKPEEEAAFLKKMLAMADEEVRTRAELSGKTEEPKSKTAGKSVRAKSAPEFHDVQLHVYDLSNANEPVLVLTANAKLSSAPDVEYMVALVARQDIYGDLHKVFARTTDNQHLDVLPRHELIDAVDADGDGHGELLFRLNSEHASAFGVYRVVGDKLWPLFEGRPGT
jgi:hypothetical protein